MKKNKIKLVIFIIILLLLSFSVYLYSNRKGYQEPEFVPSFDDLFSGFNYDFKQMLFKTYQNGGQKDAESVKKLKDNWDLIIEYYHNSQPERFAKTKDWSDKLERIFLSIKKMDENIGKIKTEDVDTIVYNIVSLKKENNEPQLDKAMYEFYKSAKKIEKAQNKDEIKAVLPEIKLSLLGLKSLDYSQEFNDDIFKIEDIVGRIDKLVASDQRKAQGELIPKFFEIYLKY